MQTDWEGDARLENLAPVRAFVADACARAGADPQVCFDLKLAVDEACTNIILHGYRREPGRIRVSFAEEAGRLTIVISDRGLSFDPGEIRPVDRKASHEERPVGGVGWHLIREATDEVSYEADPGGENRLTLVKRKSERPGG